MSLFLVTATVLVLALVDVAAGGAAAATHLDPHTGGHLEVDDVQPDEPRLDRLRQVHDGLGGAVQNTELNLIYNNIV